MRGAMRRMAATPGLLALLLALAPRAAGTSCIAPDCHLLVPSVLDAPSSLGGIPVDWYDCAQGNPRQPMPLADRFAVERRSRAGWSEIPFRVVPVGSDSPLGVVGRSLLLLVPTEGFRASETYRFTLRASGERLATSTVVAVVNAPVPPLPATTALHVGDEAIGPLTMGLDSLDCRSTSNGYPRLRASRRTVSMELPQAWRPFRRSLLYAVTVDGTSWDPGCGPCDWPGPGRSGMGPAREMIFAECELPDTSAVVGTVAGYAPRMLSPGTHEVEMVAWLPGTSMTLTARAQVVLTCDVELPPRR